MRVAEVMTTNVQSCTPDTNLSAAAMQMWDGDFGSVPVVDRDGKVIGMITDRDICMAAATRHEDITNIKVGDVSSGQVQSCSAEMSVQDALRIFEKARLHRLPVVDKDQKLQGILSITDVVRHTVDAQDRKSSGVPHPEVVNTLKAICTPHARATAAGV